MWDAETLSDLGDHPMHLVPVGRDSGTQLSMMTLLCSYLGDFTVVGHLTSLYAVCLALPDVDHVTDRSQDAGRRMAPKMCAQDVGSLLDEKRNRQFLI